MKRHTHDYQCCCEATLEGNTTHGWEHKSDCVSNADNEVSAECVGKQKCNGIK